MKNRILLILNFVLIFSLFTCVTEPKGENPQTDRPETTDNEDFKVTKKIYEETFEDVTVLVKKLNRVIASSKFKDWKSYLSTSYIKKYSNYKTLEEISENAILKKRNIKLKNLGDYFKHVVVPSRSNVKVDEIKFRDKDKVTVYMIFGQKRAVLYQLEKIKDEWKISSW